MKQKTIVVTGSQTGMGLAARQLLEAHGARVIGLSNTGGAEVRADLSREKEVQNAIAGILDLCGGILDGFFANAGVDNENAQEVFPVNYFSIVHMLQGLQPALARSHNGRVVINASNSVVITPGIPADVVEALVQMNAPLAYQLIAHYPQWTYQCSKAAITRWARQQAPRREWAGNNISMNILAPGIVRTRLIEKDLEDPRKAAAINSLPKPLGAIPLPENIAPLVKFLMLDDSRFIVGQYLVIDGGTEAAWRGGDAPSPWSISRQDFAERLHQ